MLYVAKSLFKNEVHVLFRHMKAKKHLLYIDELLQNAVPQEGGHRQSMGYKKQVTTETDKNGKY